MQKNNVLLTILLIGSVLTYLLLQSCSPKKDYTTAIAKLDSLAIALDNAYSRLAEIQPDSLANCKNMVEEHLEYVQRNYVGDMRKDMAQVLSDYRMVKKLVPDIQKKVVKLQTEVPLAKNQLAALSKALAEHATHDAAGNRMNAEYVEKAIAKEMEVANALIKELNSMVDNGIMAKEKFTKHIQQVTFWVDSIPPVKL